MNYRTGTALGDDNDQEYRALIHKRAAAKRTLTLVKKFVQSCNSDIASIKIREKTLQEAYKSFEDLQIRIDILREESDESEWEGFTEEYFSTMADLQKLSLANTQSASSSVSNLIKNETSMQLPVIHIQTFSGKYDEWFTFYDTFNSLVHSKSNLSNIQKFHYLKSSLKGEASEFLQGIEITDDNYEEAWDLLKERFHNERIITQKHIRALFELPNCHRDSTTSLR